ncbi:uncharacterized protein (TIGR01732 family) [Evansella vedderi]|uniref:Uncharacterized protein (TIGR01732 family) n=1 Tax=Evansella vedderi TaxID=38282 RepID=A0ABT9ZZZ2_9BACI|nr:YjcZ family sporulation protein [Evansella vedderi]MDQ0256535.1 uncharacterized protein (TIGR01732 family) [Evansella vedderi]
MSHYYGGYGYGDPAAAWGCCPTHAAPGFAAPAAPVAPAGGFATGFALVLVLFILLVIIGAAWAA